MAYLWEIDAKRPALFSPMNFVDTGDYIQIQGSLYGEGEDKPVNNTYLLECKKSESSCDVYSVSEIGNDHFSGIESDTVSVTKWNDHVIELTSKPWTEASNACNFYEIVIQRKNKSATYTRRPYERAPEKCQEFTTEKVMRWRFDDGAAWDTNANGTARDR